jgi:hypothetical protein
MTQPRCLKLNHYPTRWQKGRLFCLGTGVLMFENKGVVVDGKAVYIKYMTQGPM